MSVMWREILRTGGERTQAPRDTNPRERPTGGAWDPARPKLPVVKITNRIAGARTCGATGRRYLRVGGGAGAAGSAILAAARLRSSRSRSLLR